MKSFADVSCTDCRFFAPDHEEEQAQYLRHARRPSTCRRRAPTIVPEFGGSLGFWPTVNSDEWCGEFKREDSYTPRRPVSPFTHQPAPTDGTPEP